jgi:hypothetical protein
MATSVGGAIVGILRDADTTIANDQLYLDQAPTDVTTPYLTYNDAISITPELKGDGHILQMAQQLQINLWQSVDDEDPALLSQLITALDGSLFQIDGLAQTLKVAVTSVVRLDEPYDERLVHHAITIEIAHPANVY